jgi:hypothetical protein
MQRQQLNRRRTAHLFWVPHRMIPDGGLIGSAHVPTPADISLAHNTIVCPSWMNPGGPPAGNSGSEARAYAAPSR